MKSKKNNTNKSEIIEKVNLKKHIVLTFCIALVWLLNGLFCKVLNLVPRHEEIVAGISGSDHAKLLTILIGFSEIGMAIWILSGLKSRLNAVTQIAVVALMNILEFILVPELLLWGKLNSLFAFLFILVIYYNEFHLNKKDLIKISMFSFLKNHPFAIEAFFKSSLVLTFAVPKEQMQHLIPECLQLDTFNDKWAFIAVAMVQTKNLRPRGFPKTLGNDFFLIGYRVFVRFLNRKGKNLRGLYILKSETDKRKMKFFGNIFTHYNYTTTDINQLKQDGKLEINSIKSNFKILIENDRQENIPLPENSPFSNWKEARRFAGPLPYTFTYNPVSKKVLVIEGVRENWQPAPIKVLDYNFSFLSGLKLNEIKLATAFIVEDVPYYWKKGKIEKWHKKEENSRAY